MKRWLFIPLIFVLSAVSQGLVFQYLRRQISGLDTIPFPIYNIEQANQLAQVLSNGLQDNFYTLLLFQVHSFILIHFQSFQTWCIPGTFFFNLIGGSLFGMMLGFPICLMCNVIGAYFCFLMSKYFAADVVESSLKERIKPIQKQLQEHQDNQFLFMVSLRIFPGSPNWLMNITFPHIGVRQSQFIGSILIGLTPWNYLTCQAGQIISNFKNGQTIIQPQNYIILALTAIGLAGFNYFQMNSKKQR